MGLLGGFGRNATLLQHARNATETRNIVTRVLHQMASIHRDDRTGNWIIAFRYGGRQFHRSCGTDSRADARTVESNVEETIRMLGQGRLTMPDGADVPTWIMSGGKIEQKHELIRAAFSKVSDDYFAAQTDKKAASTLKAEEIHIRHLKRVLKSATLDRIDLSMMSKYEKHRRKKDGVIGKTIRKELVTFRQIWAWAKLHKLTDKRCPIYGEDDKWAIKLAKSDDVEVFMPWETIESRIKKGGDESLWKWLFLDSDQVSEFLGFVKQNSDTDFLYPMLVFAACTGARRSELVQSIRDDFDFDHDQVTIRERKRVKSKASTSRTVPMYPLLKTAMQDWFRKTDDYMTLKDDLKPEHAYRQFKRVLKGSKWEVVRGFHVLRHSFGANAARSGDVSRDVVGTWMGHSTEDMKKHYQHLFPSDGVALITSLGYVAVPQPTA